MRGSIWFTMTLSFWLVGNLLSIVLPFLWILHFVTPFIVVFFFPTLTRSQRYMFISLDLIKFGYYGIAVSSLLEATEPKDLGLPFSLTAIATCYGVIVCALSPYVLYPAVIRKLKLYERVGKIFRK